MNVNSPIEADAAALVAALKEQNAQSTAEIVKQIEKQTKLLVAAIDRQTDAIAFQNLPEKTLEFNYEGTSIRLFIPLGDHDFVQSAIMRGRTFYEEARLRAIRDTFDLQGKTVLDIGANIGNHSVYFAAVCGVAKCISFEPNPFPASILSRNIEINQLTNVEIRPIALSDKPGSLTFGRYVARNVGATSFNEAEDGKIVAARLDDLEIGNVDFVKIDVEGMATKVLEGARQTLTACRPGLMVEMFKDEVAEGTSILQSLGYQRIRDLGAGNYLFRHGDG